jgi:hypothetical protein
MINQIMGDEPHNKAAQGDILIIITDATVGVSTRPSEGDGRRHEMAARFATWNEVVGLPRQLHRGTK